MYRNQPRASSNTGEFEKCLDLCLRAVTGGHIAVQIEAARMAICQMPGQGGFRAEGLGKKDSRDIGVEISFQCRVIRGLIFHATGPAIDMGGVRKEGEKGKIPGRHPPETGSRCASGQFCMGIEWTGRRR